MSNKLIEVMGLSNPPEPLRKVVKNPIFWIVSAMLMLMASFGMVIFISVGTTGAYGGALATVLLVLYGLAYLTIAMALGAIIYYFTVRSGNYINYSTSLIPFGVIILLGLFTMLFSGFSLTLVFVFSVLGAIILSVPYTIGYAAAYAVVNNFRSTEEEIIITKPAKVEVEEGVTFGGFLRDKGKKVSLDEMLHNKKISTFTVDENDEKIEETENIEETISTTTEEKLTELDVEEIEAVGEVKEVENIEEAENIEEVEAVNQFENIEASPMGKNVTEEDEEALIEAYKTIVNAEELDEANIENDSIDISIDKIPTILETNDSIDEETDIAIIQEAAVEELTKTSILETIPENDENLETIPETILEVTETVDNVTILEETDQEAERRAEALREVARETPEAETFYQPGAVRRNERRKRNRNKNKNRGGNRNKNRNGNGGQKAQVLVEEVKEPSEHEQFLANLDEIIVKMKS